MATTSDLFTQSARTSRYFRMSQTFGAAISFGRLLESKTPEHKASNNRQSNADTYRNEKDARTMIGSRPKPSGNNKQEANSGASSQGRNPVRTVAAHRRPLGENIAPSKRVFAPTASCRPASLLRNDAAHKGWSGTTGKNPGAPRGDSPAQPRGLPGQRHPITPCSLLARYS